MIATCTICGEIIKVLPNLKGQIHTVGEMAGAFIKHMDQKRHFELPQTAVDQADCPGPIASLGPIMGEAVKLAILYSYLWSEDPGFVAVVGKMRDNVIKAVDQKPKLYAEKPLLQPPAA